jgi:hypothetical protein
MPYGQLFAIASDWNEARRFALRMTPVRPKTEFGIAAKAVNYIMSE